MFKSDIAKKLCPSLRESLMNKEVERPGFKILDSFIPELLFRRVEKKIHKQLEESDFYSQVEMHMAGIKMSARYRDIPLASLRKDLGCHSVSLNRKAELLIASKNISAKSKKPSIVYLELSPDHGCIDDRKSDHVHWWKYDDVHPEKLFKYCDL